MNELTVTNPRSLVIVAESLQVEAKTKETYTNAMVSFARFCQNEGFSEDLDSLRAWLNSITVPATKALYIAAAKKVLNSLYKGDPRLIEVNEILASIKPLKRKMTVTESKYLNRREVDALIAGSSERVGLIIETLFVTALRISELLNIKLSDCVPIREGNVYEIRVIGKGNKQNLVFINKELYDRLRIVFKSKPFLIGHQKEKYRREYVSKRIKDYGFKVLNKKIGAHTLRHSRAYDLMEKGVSIDKVSKYLNHSTLSTTANFYLHTTPTLEELGVL